LSGNFSLEASLFARVGGFDPELWCHEDYELGVRLLKAGANFTFTAEALGYHHETVDVGRALQRKYQEGRADVLLGARHPELRAQLPLAQIERLPLLLSLILRSLVFSQRVMGDALVMPLPHLLNLLERLQLYRSWRRLLDGLYGYWYWRGVAAEVGNRQALDDFQQGSFLHAEDTNHSQRDLTRGVSLLKAFLSTDRVNKSKRVSTD